MKSQTAMPIAIVVILIAVIVPLPTIVLDLLISTNIAISVVIILGSLYLLNPVQFSAFPSILLLTTLFRLSLNIERRERTGTLGYVMSSRGETASWAGTTFAF